MFAPSTEAGVCARRVGRRGNAFQDAAGTKFRFEGRIFRIVGVFGLVLGVEVIKIAKELVEAVHGRQELVAVAEVVLAELSGGIALRLEQLGDGWVLGRQPLLCRRQSDLQEPGAQRALPSDEGRASRGAGLLAVVIRKDGPFGGDAVELGVR